MCGIMTQPPALLTWFHLQLVFRSVTLVNCVVGVFLIYNISPILPRDYHFYMSYISYFFIGLMLLCLGIIMGNYSIEFLTLKVRLLMFLMVYIFTFGGVYFWILPSFTKDCGFFDSFKPAYSIQYYKKPEVKKEKSPGIWALLKESFHYIFGLLLIWGFWVF